MRSILVAGVVATFASTALIGAAFAQGQPQWPATLPPPTETAPKVAPTTTAAQGDSSCPGNPDAIGTARTIAIDPKTSPMLGRLQYKQTLPLEKGEVVLTFDDGPLPPMTNRVLDALAHECVKATFFSVGTMAAAHPKIVQKILADGHTIGTHSQTHPLIFPKLTQEAGIQEIEQGFASVRVALKPVGGVTQPWFRFPGLGRTKFYEAYAQEHGLAIFSVDAVADDWLHLKPDEVEKRALERLEARGGGILLLHDIQPSTAVMLPDLLRQLKARGFRIVHVVPAGPGMTASLPSPGPSGRMPSTTAAKPSPAPGATTAAKPVTPTTPRVAAPAPRTATGVPAQAQAQAAVSSPQPIAPVSPQPAAGDGEGTQDNNPFTQFWPKVWNDTFGKIGQ
ncbi:hypothetical protein GCM10007301_13990 [Azorhizobium oxalatiphilum]|uniref:Chitooligosaccharide deacetylase n=1 Tax=Azorhizobium oxalatiphilum TaxID=980631 RepID=A0A917F9H5_9HYPH|nr:polysaccharide deacetylase family protein [Azorhizobium oxalatiphilum]GGF55541.1 hypothetical protein GCM10007301_13990 [Azorhizobium oxalatiphilum]